jgi:GNAT superfamily N-acetyltransferase
MDVEIKPITRDIWPSVVHKCWPTKEEDIERLFDDQEALGMAAWVDGESAALCQFYRVSPDGKHHHFPSWSHPGWLDELPSLELRGPALATSCFHVGTTHASMHNQMLQLVERFAKQHQWDAGDTTRALNALDGVAVTEQEVEGYTKEIRSLSGKIGPGVEEKYLGKGLGRALLKATVDWAQGNGYGAVISGGPPREFLGMGNGALPWTTHEKLGFLAWKIVALDYGEGHPYTDRLGQLRKKGWSERALTRRVMVKILK